MSELFATLPAPIKAVVAERPVTPPPITTALVTTTIPPYGSRKGWQPKSVADYGDGGAYPEIPIAQYPLEMGRKKAHKSGGTLSLQVDADGNVNYDAIAKQGHREGVIVQSQFKDLVPLAQRMDISEESKQMLRPTDKEIEDTTVRTKAALDKLVDGKIKATQPKNVQSGKGDVSYIRYTPAGEDGKQRIIKMIDVVEDPLDPPKFKGKKIPRGPPSPPPPVLRSPPRKVTAKEQKEWMIPPCVSNWKNNKGYTIPLDKRLAADGRGLQDIHINDRHAQLAESLHAADKLAREEVRTRALMQQRIAQKEKEDKENNLRMLAQQAREQRAGKDTRVGSRVVASKAEMGGALANYGSDSDDSQGSTPKVARPVENDADTESEGEEASDPEDDQAARERDAIRRDRRKERERELRMNNMGTEQRARVLARATGRDISEKVALGLAKPTLSKDSMIDARLFNREQLSNTFRDDDSYNLYDKPLFSGSSAAAAIYKPRGANVDEDGNEIDDKEGVVKSMQNSRFGMGVAAKGFEGADTTEVRDGPVAFEKDVADPYGVDAFLEDAKKAGMKRGLNTQETSRKKTREE